ncbi:MAG: CBS and ACT domain-containing protein [Desulfobulbaceae bacterium]|jgi:acetoin utilization protein AcuB|nr:CBS and ACT domain-containing protein [Desulfobulbaceae bacterium]
MKIKSWMHPSPVTIHREALLQDAQKLMKENDFRHLPVVDENGHMVGFITESDLRQFSFPAMVEDIPVHQVMVINPITINLNANVETAAKLIHDYKIGGLPVLDKKKLVGIITLSDLLAAFIEVMGLFKSSTRLDVIVSKKGGVDDVTRIIKRHKVEIVSVALESQTSRRKVHYFRLDKCDDVEPIVKALEKAGHKVIAVME